MHDYTHIWIHTYTHTYIQTAYLRAAHIVGVCERSGQATASQVAVHVVHGPGQRALRLRGGRMRAQSGQVAQVLRIATVAGG